MKTFGYIRVSSKDQNEDRQRETMFKEGINERDLLIDKISGKDFNRPEYQLLKKMVRKGDIVVFDSITRMGRNMNDTMKEYEWFVENGIQLRFVKESMINTTNDKDDVMKQAIQKIILTLLTAFAEKERDEIRIRQAEGIAIAKAKGKHLGRPRLNLKSISKEQNQKLKQNYPAWKNKEITGVQFANMLELKKNTFYKILKEYESSL